MQRFLESMFSDIMRHQQPGNNGRWGVRYIVRQACLLGLGGIVMGQGDKYPVEDVCNIALARGIVLGDKMYVDGGRIIEKEQYNSSEDKPAYFGDLKWVQSEPPSNQCPLSLIDCRFAEPIPYFQMRIFGNLTFQSSSMLQHPHGPGSKSHRTGTSITMV